MIVNDDSLINFNSTQIITLLTDSKYSTNPIDCIILFEIIKDCSTYNPCGPYGYCENDFHGRWTCVCKFWWKGTLCDTCESNDKQS